MLLIDTEGRALIKQLQNSSEIYAKNISELKGIPGHWNTATANRDSHKDLKSRERGKNRESSSSDDEEQEEEGEGEGESGSSGIESDTSNSDDDDDEIRDEGEVERKEKKRRRRSGAGRDMQRKSTAISHRSKDSHLIALIMSFHTILHSTCAICVLCDASTLTYSIIQYTKQCHFVTFYLRYSFITRCIIFSSLSSPLPSP